MTTINDKQQERQEQEVNVDIKGSWTGPDAGAISVDELAAAAEEETKEEEEQVIQEKLMNKGTEQAPDMSTSANAQTRSYNNTVDLDDMKDKVFFLFEDRNRRLSKFWLLIILASVIATSGIAGDAPATVIGAMIVAPLMVPIMGTMLAIVLGDGRNFLFSIMLVLTGAGSAILIGFVYGSFLNEDSILAENNSQVAARVEPQMTDLIGAIATGIVGAVALVRKDVGDTLPGVAISISLVPPLCVAGLTLSTGNGHQALSALLLFATNVASILSMGVLVMYIYKVYELRKGDKTKKTAAKRMAILLLFGMLAALAVPLAFTSQRIKQINGIESCLYDAFGEYGDPFGWRVTVVIATGSPNEYTAEVFMTGSPPFPEPAGKGTRPVQTAEEKAIVCGVDEIVLKFIPVEEVMV